MAVRAFEPISPELVLVASPEEAVRARELLPPAPPSTLDLLAARLRERPPTAVAPAAAAAATPDAVPAARGRRRRLVLAGVVVLLLAAATAAWIERPRPLRPSFATAASPAPPARRDTAPPARRDTAPPAQRAAAPTATPRTVESAAVPGAGVFVPARTWVWSPVATATAYRFELTLNGRVALRLRTARPSLVLPRSFHFRAGTYRWNVRPIPANDGPPLTDSRFTLTAAAAALANR